jgi:hypothetical protein
MKTAVFLERLHSIRDEEWKSAVAHACGSANPLKTPDKFKNMRKKTGDEIDVDAVLRKAMPLYLTYTCSREAYEKFPRDAVK